MITNEVGDTDTAIIHIDADATNVRPLLYVHICLFKKFQDTN